MTVDGLAQKAPAVCKPPPAFVNLCRPLSLHVCLYEPIDKDLTTHRRSFPGKVVNVVRGKGLRELPRSPHLTHIQIQKHGNTDTVAPAAKTPKSTKSPSGKEGLELVVTRLSRKALFNFQFSFQRRANAN